MPEKETLSEQALVELGFVFVGSVDNSPEPWWEHPILGIKFHGGLPSQLQFFNAVMGKAFDDGEQAVQEKIRSALGL